MHELFLILPSRLSRNRSCQLSVAGILLVLAVFTQSGLADEPLATCAVQKITAVNNSYEMPPNAVLAAMTPSQPDPLDNYMRGADGQWQIPQQVDRNDPLLRLLILGPERPMLIDVAVYLEDRPFTEAREKLIDTLLNHATVESLVRDAVTVPIREETLAEPKATEAPVETATSSDTDMSAEGEASSEPSPPMVEIKRRAARTVAERLVNYMASAEVNADREEIRWLLAEWTGGPAILSLGPAMSWQRMGMAPLWNVLDVDGDSRLNAKEIAAAPERLSQADVDENSIVEIEELTALSTRTATMPPSYPLAVILNHETDWSQLQSYLAAAYGRRGQDQQGSAPSTTPALIDRIARGESLAASELELLLDEPALAKFQVYLGGNESRAALLSTNVVNRSASENTITLVQGSQYVEFSAGVPEAKEPSEPVATQVAIGAVVDGFSLFRLADRNGDRRLSPRERRTLPKTLAALDLDGDGEISAAERPTAIRLAVSHGPHVHDMLKTPTSATHEWASSEAVTKPETSPQPTEVPAWFTDMDRNRDGDLSREEFLGTTEQFRQLDRDGDGLVGSEEITN